MSPDPLPAGGVWARDYKKAGLDIVANVNQFFES